MAEDRKPDDGPGVDRVAGLSLLNMLWLLGIAFLPFPTALVGQEVTTTSAPIYLGTMLVLSALTVVMSLRVRRVVDAPRRNGLIWMTSAVFAVGTLVSLAQPALGMYLLLLLIPIRIVEGRLERASAGTAP